MSAAHEQLYRQYQRERGMISISSQLIIFLVKSFLKVIIYTTNSLDSLLFSRFLHH